MARILGLDIDSHSVRAVLVRTSFGRAEPLEYLEVPIVEEDASPDGGDLASWTDGGTTLDGLAPATMGGPPPPPQPGASGHAMAGAGLGFDDESTADDVFAPNGAPATAAYGQRAPRMQLPGGFGDPLRESPQGLADALEPMDSATVAADTSSDESVAPQLVDEPSGVELSPLERARRRAIRTMISRINPPPDQVIAGLDGKEASLRLVEIPSGIAKKAGRIAEVLPFQLDDMVPFDIEETVVDYQIIGEDGPTTRLLATAVPKTTVAARLRELKAIGIDPIAMPVGAAALDGLSAFVPQLMEPGPALVLEVEDANTEMCIVAHGVCVFARSLALGIEELADPTRRGHVLGTFKRSLGGYRAAGGAPFERAYLCGEGVRHAEGLTAFLSREVLNGLMVELLPLPQLEGFTEEADRPRFARAAALAGHTMVKGKRLDLRQGEFAKSQTRGLVKEHARLLAICAAAIFVSFIYATWARWSVLGEEQEELRGRLASVTEELFDEETRSATQARELLEGGSKVIDPLPTMSAFDVLDAITSSIPPEIHHDTRRLDIEIDDVAREGRFEIQGTVASIAERDTIKGKLEEHDCFTEVDPGPTSPGPGNEGLNYRLEVTIKCPGDEPLTPADNTRRSRRGRS